jgi:hypothetical protein
MLNKTVSGKTTAGLRQGLFLVNTDGGIRNRK